MNTLEFLQSKGIETVYCTNPYVVSEKREKELKPEHMVRGIHPTELLIELDIKKDGADTPELRKQLYDLQLKNFEKIAAQGFEVYLFNHQGKSPHIRLYGFNELTQRTQESYFKNFVQKYCYPSLEGTAYDKSFYGSFHWCPIEFHKHYKYGTTYALEKVANEGTKNKFDLSLITEEKTTDKRKIELEYWDILKSENPDEKERVSAIMQIFNKYGFTQEETLAFVIKHNQWKDFNPGITETKIKEIFVRYPKKENPVQQAREDKALKDLFEKTQYIANFDNIAANIVNELGIYYDDYKLWWIWNKDKKKWERKDDTDILNVVDAAIQFDKSTLEQKFKGIILEGLRREGRKNRPKELPLYCIQFKSTIINYMTDETFPATREYFATNPIPWDLGDSEETPCLDKLFVEWVGKDYAPRLAEIVAFSIQPDYFIDKIFCYVGIGSNGKSTYQDFIDTFVGEDNICVIDFDQIASGNRFETSQMYKKLVARMSETNYTTISKTNLIKQLSSGKEKIKFEFKGKDPFKGPNTAKLHVGTNGLPKSNDNTDGWWRRWLITKFPNQFKEQKNPVCDITEKEFCNFARKCCRLLKELRASHEFHKQLSIIEQRIEYESLSNPINKFIEENYIKEESCFVPRFEFAKKFESYLAGQKIRQYSDKELAEALKDAGFTVEKEHISRKDGSRTTWRVVYGIRDKLPLERDWIRMDTLDTVPPNCPSPVERSSNPVSMGIQRIHLDGLELVDGSPYGKCRNCGKTDYFICAIDKVLKAGICFDCYNKLKE